ncbi:DUF1971 domain-containing protein [Candidatus Poriferisocius sp.]|uniref:DUF1971 domain-containing protein n=1 Tax=Candidatus Poriferisocius sp. TaxID=3101276 RepID=UPI003B015B9B
MGSNEPRIPSGAVTGRKTPVFNARTMPPALGRDHIATVWAELTVVRGSVQFLEETGRSQTATPGNPVTITPNLKHHVVPNPNAEFYIQFYEVSDHWE